MKVDEYQKLSETNQPFVELNGQLHSMPFLITPNSKIIKSGELKRLGDQPLDIKTSDFQMSVYYPGGIVSYYVDKGNILPEQIVIYGITREPGVRSLNTEKLDTTILFIPVEDDNLQEGKEYLHYGETHLEVHTTEGETERIKDWWVGEKQG